MAMKGINSGKFLCGRRVEESDAMGVGGGGGDCGGEFPSVMVGQ